MGGNGDTSHFIEISIFRSKEPYLGLPLHSSDEIGCVLIFQIVHLLAATNLTRFVARPARLERATCGDVEEVTTF